jgi:hypothetical protein
VAGQNVAIINYNDASQPAPGLHRIAGFITLARMMPVFSLDERLSSLN